MQFRLKTIAILLLSGILVSIHAKAENNNPSASGDLLNLKDATSFSEIKSAENAVLSLFEDGNERAVKIEFSAQSQFPGASFPCPAGGWDLLSFVGIEAEITNAGTAPIKVNLRVDNDGDWKTNPWNADHAVIAPGETKALRVTFGKSYGNAGYPLDPKHVTKIQIFAAAPSEDGTMIVRTLKGMN